MAIVNRDLDTSQKKESVQSVVASLALGASHAVIAVPQYPVELKYVAVSPVAIAAAPVLSLEIIRFVTGAGLTVIPGIAATLAVAAHGTSGVQGFSLAAPGSTLLNLQSGDMLGIRIPGASGAVTTMGVNVIWNPTQDIKGAFGSQT